MKKIFKWVAIIIIGLVVISFVSALATSEGRQSFQSGFQDARDQANQEIAE